MSKLKKNESAWRDCEAAAEIVTCWRRIGSALRTSAALEDGCKFSQNRSLGNNPATK